MTANQSFFQQAAKASWVSPLLVILLGFFSRSALSSKETLDPEMARVGWIVIGAIGVLLVSMGMIAGIVALFGIPKFGWKGILIPSLIGIVLCAGYFYLLANALLVVRQIAAEKRALQSLPVWEPDPSKFASLGEQFSDRQISIRPPRGFMRIEQQFQPELERQGVFRYGWSPGGMSPSLSNLSVSLTPFARPSLDALNETLRGFKDSMDRQIEGLEFAEVEQGKFLGVAALSGSFKGTLDGTALRGFYLLGIDTTGSFMICAMLPKSETTSERILAIRDSMMTFERASQ